VDEDVIETQPTMEMKEEDLSIRTTRISDTSEILGLVEQDRTELANWLPDLGKILSIADAENYLKSHWFENPDTLSDCHSFVILSDKKIVGMIGTTKHSLTNDIYLEYWLTPAERGKGVMQRAVSLISKKSLSIPKVSNVFIKVQVENQASANVALRAWFRYKRTNPEIYVDGKLRIFNYYVLSKDDTVAKEQVE